MKLLEELKDLKAQVGDITDLVDDIEDDDIVVEEDEEDLDDAGEEETAQEESEPEKKPEKQEVKEELDDAGYARIRREEMAAKKRIRELEEQLAKVTKGDQGEPESGRIDPIVERIIERARFSEAENEFKRLEADFVSRVRPSDYDDLSASYTAAIMNKITLENPRLSMVDVAEKTKEFMLVKARDYLIKGFDPIEEIYHDAKSLREKGMLPSIKKQEDAPKEQTPSPDLKKIAQNKARNSGMAGAKGSGGERELTRESAASMSPAQWARLAPAERKRILGEK